MERIDSEYLISELKDLVKHKTLRSLASAFHVFLTPQNSIGIGLLSPWRQISFLLQLTASITDESDDIVSINEVLDICKSLTRLYIPEELSTIRPNNISDELWPIFYKAISHLQITQNQSSEEYLEDIQLAKRCDYLFASFDSPIRASLGVGYGEILKFLTLLNELSDKDTRMKVSAQRNLDNRKKILRRKSRRSNQPYESLIESDNTIKNCRKEIFSIPVFEWSIFQSILNVQEIHSLRSLFELKLNIPQIYTTNDTSLQSFCPLIPSSEDMFILFHINWIYYRAFSLMEEAIIKSDHASKYYDHKSKSLETRTKQSLLSIFGDSSTHQSTYETTTANHEHDFVTFLNENTLITECKGSNVRKVEKNPWSSAARIWDHFKGNSGPRHALEQIQKLARAIHANQEVPLYNKKGAEVTRIKAPISNRVLGLVISEFNFGPLATKLTL